MKKLESSSGFTFIEMVVVLVVAFIMSAIAATNFSQWQENTRFRGAVTTLFVDLQSVKMEAIKRNIAMGIDFDYTGSGSYTLFLDSNDSGSFDAGEELRTVTLGDKTEKTHGVRIYKNGIDEKFDPDDGASPSYSPLDTIVYDPMGIPDDGGYIRIANQSNTRENLIVINTAGNQRIN